MYCLFFLFFFLFFFLLFFFFFNDTATTEIYTLSLHDALPISWLQGWRTISLVDPLCTASTDRKSTRLNSSHHSISYAVFCLKKKKNKRTNKLIKNNEDQEKDKQQKEYKD